MRSQDHQAQPEVHVQLLWWANEVEKPFGTSLGPKGGLRAKCKLLVGPGSRVLRGKYSRFDLHVNSGPFGSRMEAHLAVCAYLLSSYESVALVDFVARNGRSLRRWHDDTEYVSDYSPEDEVSALRFYLDFLPRLLVRDRLVQDGITLAVRRLHQLLPGEPVVIVSWPRDVARFELFGTVRDMDDDGKKLDPGKNEAFVLVDALLLNAEPCSWLASPDAFWKFVTARRNLFDQPSVVALAAAYGPPRRRAPAAMAEEIAPVSPRVPHVPTQSPQQRDPHPRVQAVEPPLSMGWRPGERCRNHMREAAPRHAESAAPTPLGFLPGATMRLPPSLTWVPGQRRF